MSRYGGVLGVFDGLTALISAPEVAPMIVGYATQRYGRSPGTPQRVRA
jgi:hypothetical protein